MRRGCRAAHPPPQHPGPLLPSPSPLPGEEGGGSPCKGGLCSAWGFNPRRAACSGNAETPAGPALRGGVPTLMACQRYAETDWDVSTVSEVSEVSEVSVSRVAGAGLGI